MSAKVKTKKTKEEDLKGTKISFNQKDDFKAIKLKSDGNVYVEHKFLADKLIKKGLAEESKNTEIELSESNTQILKDNK